MEGQGEVGVLGKRERERRGRGLLGEKRVGKVGAIRKEGEGVMRREEG